ncbi:hypothetical protein [Stutzerimonas stutzeri]|uniref:hypothetical protein n=1 Tax=Stutzerimonas stutzeri TaxID=316 RepID=UPI001C7936DC|nr:hypothetical protein [Stutzerimonas stutzeri]BCY02369.1 hypothetical protein PszF2a_21580 [Stutzerimonas stutzeri]
MKAYLRLLLVLLLSLALPLNGMAASPLSALPCQMQKDAQAAEYPGHMAVAPDEDGHAHQSNPLCDGGHQCKTGSPLVTMLARPALNVAPPLLGAAYLEFLPARSGADVWRPPRH